MNNQLITDKLKKYFSDQNNILLAFLFGSTAAGRNSARSDVDVAVRLADGYSQTEVDKIWREIETIAQKEVDLVVLNDCRPTIAWTALRGKPLLIRNYRLYLSMITRVSAEAEDFREFVLDFWRWRKKLGGTFA
ncbi:nucleotidyltransferase domain-containing protein [Candidatus Saganbacteria bacterium]|nr:nucleotidyltransferase domain-containing protein [Candidatus Saganbacteria bacterium]